MGDSGSQDQVNAKDEAELTPEAMHIIGRARRSFGVSMTIMLLGFVAVVGALVYRVSQSSNAPVMPEALAQVVLPSGAEVISASQSGRALLLTYRIGTDTKIAWVNSETGAIDGTTDISSE